MKSILIFFIHIYQILPLSSHQMCRFTPTCSNYAKEAISTYGVWKGCKLSMKRIMKCRPKGSFGYDPVPRKEEKS